MTFSIETANIFHVGKFHVGSTALGRSSGLKKLAVTYRRLDLSEYFPPGKRGWYSLQRLISDGPDVVRLNRDIRKAAAEQCPNLIFIEKGLLIYPETIQSFRGLKSAPLVVHYSPDDQMNPSNISRHYRASLPLFDVHVTTKPFNIDELANLGARIVILQRVGFDPELHRILPESIERQHAYGASVSFVGAYEDERARSISTLAGADFDVRVWGPGWRSSGISTAENVTIEGRAVWGDDYTAVINGSKVNLCFLRKVNRDVSTSRTVEIPASGGFMLGERTDEHLAIFKEGTEAEFFSSDAELLDKTVYYLAHEDQRRKIAAAGYKRVHDDYSYVNVMRDTLIELTDLHRQL